MKEFKTWEELTISDNFIFQNVMKNPEICKMFLEKLLHIKIKNITYPELEKIFNVGLISKGIRLDVYTEDEGGTIYDIEMQTTNSPQDDLPKRTRYYQSLIDANILNKGTDYSELKNLFVIFVCTFDPFSENRRIYTFKNTCREISNLFLEDGATKIFLNAEGNCGEVDEDIENFLNFIDGKDARGTFTENIAAETDKVKRRDELKVEYMTFTAEMMKNRRIGRAEGWAEGKAEGRAEGEAVGRAEGEIVGKEKGKFELIKNLLSADTPLEYIMKATGWSKEKILAVKDFQIQREDVIPD